MQHHNVNKVDIITEKVTANLVSDFKNVITDVGIDLSYLLYNTNYNDWTDIISVKGYVMSSSDEDSGSFDVKDKYSVLISVESFYNSAGALIGEPTKKDKVIIGSYDYHVVDRYFYNIQSELTNTIRNAMAIGIDLIRKGGFTRNDLIR